jgi:hypothetical protein
MDNFLGLFGIGVILTFFFFFMALAVLIIMSMWKIFTKAGEEGWASIIPVYSSIVFLKVIGKPMWWLALILIPFVNIIGMFVWMISGSHALSKSFGKDVGFTLGLIFLPIIFYPILAFDRTIVYVGPGGNAVGLDKQVDSIGNPAI